MKTLTRPRRRVKAHSWADLPKDRRPFWPRGAAKDLLYAKEQEVLICGPTGTGKSRPALEKLNLIATKYPGARLAMLRRTRKSLTQSAMVTFENHVLPAGFPCKFHGGDQEYRYPNGSRIIVGGLDQASKIMSTEFDVMYIMEATEVTEEQWEKCLTRLRNGKVPYQQLIADCNPDAPSHWLKLRCDRGATRLLNSWLKDNPIFFDPITEEWTEEGLRYRAILENMTGVRRLRLLDGKWAAAEGIVYDLWDPDTHLIDAAQFNAMVGREPDAPLSIPYDWPRFVSIDFGYVDPMAIQWWALDHDHRMYLYREIYVTGQLVEDMAEVIRHYSQAEELTAMVTEHDRDARGILERRLGIYTTPAIKDIETGIQAVRARLRVQPDGKPRLFILRDALVEPDLALMAAKKPFCTAQEFESYIYDPKPSHTAAAREQPIDKDNHGLDSLRYACMYVEDALYGGGEDITGQV